MKPWAGWEFDCDYRNSFTPLCEGAKTKHVELCKGRSDPIKWGRDNKFLYSRVLHSLFPKHTWTRRIFK